MPLSSKELMKTLARNISYSVTHTFTYGAFAAASYIFPEKTSSSANEYKDAFDTDVLSRATCIDEDGNKYPPEIPLDDSWGIIDYKSLSVVFKNTNPPPKPPRRAMKLRD